MECCAGCAPVGVGGEEYVLGFRFYWYSFARRLVLDGLFRGKIYTDMFIFAIHYLSWTFAFHSLSCLLSPLRPPVRRSVSRSISRSVSSLFVGTIYFFKRVGSSDFVYFIVAPFVTAPRIDHS